MSERLNEKVLAALPVPPKNDTLHFFKGTVSGIPIVRGFAVRVTKAGVKSFVLDYRAGARQRRLTIGRWPDSSVASAVREARELRQRVDRGDDPLAARQAARIAALPVE